MAELPALGEKLSGFFAATSPKNRQSFIAVIEPIPDPTHASQTEILGCHA